MNLTNKTIVLLIALVFVGRSAAWADKKPKSGTEKKGYNITLHIENNTDSVFYLGNYYANNMYAIDTAVRDKKGNFVFSKKERTLPAGLYFFTNPAHDYVEFMVFEEYPDFKFTTDNSDWAGKMKVQGSKQNELFIEYRQRNKVLYHELDSLKKVVTDPAAYKQLSRDKRHSLDSLYINKYPNTMVGMMLKAMWEPDVPETDSAGNALTNRQRFEYYMDHYFDNMAMDQDFLVRTPEVVFYNRINNYLDKSLRGSDPETLIFYIDQMIDRARPSKEVFKYLVHSITEKYLQSKVMSYDEVYVHMIKRYYASGEAFWSSPSFIDEETKRANTWERLLIGKPAPELVMKDIDGRPRYMYQIPNKYTLLVFWSPSCGHCKTTIPELYEVFSRFRQRCDIAGYAVLSEPDDQTRPKWRKFIDDHHLEWFNMDGGEANIDWHEVYDVETTPQIYLLDKDKVILAKKFTPESFEYILRTLENIPDDELKKPETKTEEN